MIVHQNVVPRKSGKVFARRLIAIGIIQGEVWKRRRPEEGGGLQRGQVHKTAIHRTKLENALLALLLKLRQVRANKLSRDEKGTTTNQAKLSRRNILLEPQMSGGLRTKGSVPSSTSCIVQVKVHRRFRLLVFHIFSPNSKGAGPCSAPTP